MGKIQKNQNGFSAIEGLLILVVVAIIGGTGFYIYHANKKTSNTYNSATQASQSNPKFSKSKAKVSTAKTTNTTQSTDPTANWTSFTSQDGKLSLKYPSNWVLTPNCPDNQFDAGPTSSSASACNTDTNDTPEISVSDTNKGCFPLDSGYSDNSQQHVTISGISGTEYMGTYQDSNGSYPTGTKIIEYCLPGTSLTYEAYYTQQPSYPDMSSDFNTIVTKTLTFN